MRRTAAWSWWREATSTIASVRRRVAYPAYVEALLALGYEGFIDWEFCHPAIENGKPAGIDYIHDQTRLALEYMKGLRAKFQTK